MTKEIIILDFETRSKCDLKKEGVYNYASHHSTQILCLAVSYASPEENEEWLWYPSEEKEMPDEMAFVIEDATLVMAHNAAFDRLIYEYIAEPDHNAPVIPAAYWYCTSAQARVNALPAGLDGLTSCLDSKFKKDHSGSALIRLLSIPNKLTGEFNEDPVKLKEMGEYCLGDVRATKAAVNSIRSMTQGEHEDWLVSEEINERGIKIDREMAQAAQEYAAEEQEAIGAYLSDLTGGIVTKHSQTIRARDWVFRMVKDTPDEERITNIMTVYKTDPQTKEVTKKFTLDKNARTQLIDLSDMNEIVLSNEVYGVLEGINDGSKSSVAKFKNMLLRADPDTDRVYGAFVYAGASQTLRFASRGLQLHNMIRDCFNPKEAEDLKFKMCYALPLTLNDEDLPVMATLGKLLRPALIPEEGHVFVVGDWSSIEARVLPWLANTPKAEKRLDLFRADKDVYKLAASAIYKTKEDDINDKQRQTGKVAELALGYGGAAGAFSSMAKQFGITDLSDGAISQIVNAWRDENQWAVDFWNALEKAAKRAIRNPNQEFFVGRVSYIFLPNLIEGTLICRMPDDMIIQYPMARLEMKETPYGKKLSITAMKAGWTPKADATEWPRVGLWRGLLAENIAQAFAAKLLRWLLKEFRDSVVGHVHDEAILEVLRHMGAPTRDLLQIVMERGPAWAEGLPLKAEPVIMGRYGK